MARHSQNSSNGQLQPENNRGRHQPRRHAGKDSAFPVERIRDRRQARQAALQVLYEVDTTDHKPGPVLEARQADVQLRPEGVAFLRWLIAGVIQNKEDLDHLIGRYAPEWPVQQLAVIDRNILRLALFELVSPDSDAPGKVVINEAVEMAKIFGSDSSSRFVNGVLGTALAELSSANN